ncbi:hypothetical protein [Bradyrhizobium sp. CCBAU 11361]|uniref:hypothetical protein n=1 Tax=Bradyrhizobium sp. CCBAU 11361 TaxID=1630812 RepID=UPI002304279B|nr:hypothetical protein [Bradyrhizobium sp. CCBAU 11361]MDA9489342.1 hypothetical protein [Bradyrhizobium sp. CCBAU 11361]
MLPDDLLTHIEARMREIGASQSTVAKVCELSQPHLSKVLNRKIKLAKKTAAKLESWLTAPTEAPAPPPSPTSLATIATKLEGLAPKRRMQFMQLLAAVDDLLNS